MLFMISLASIAAFVAIAIVLEPRRGDHRPSSRVNAERLVRLARPRNKARESETGAETGRVVRLPVRPRPLLPTLLSRASAAPVRFDGFDAAEDRLILIWDGAEPAPKLQLLSDEGGLRQVLLADGMPVALVRGGGLTLDRIALITSHAAKARSAA